VTLLMNFSVNEDVIFTVFWTRLMNMDSANKCFSGCVRYHNMNGRAIRGAYLFRLYACDKEMS